MRPFKQFFVCLFFCFSQTKLEAKRLPMSLFSLFPFALPANQQKLKITLVTKFFLKKKKTKCKLSEALEDDSFPVNQSNGGATLQ